MEKEKRIPKPNIKSTATTKRRHANAFCPWKDDGTQRLRIRSDPISGKTHNTSGARQHTHLVQASVQPCGVKTERTSCDAACKTTSTARHRKFSATTESTSDMPAKIHAHTRNENVPGDVDAKGQKWRTLLGQPFYVATKSHTQKIQHFRNFKHTREKEDSTAATTTHSKKTLAKLRTTRFLCTFLRRCAKPETTKPKQNIHIKRKKPDRHRTIRKT